MKKTKVKATAVMKKDEKCQTSNTHYSVRWAAAAMKLVEHEDLGQIYMPTKTQD